MLAVVRRREAVQFLAWSIGAALSSRRSKSGSPRAIAIEKLRSRTYVRSATEMLDSYSTIDVFDHGILGADLTSHNHRSEVLVAATYIDLALSEALMKRFISLSKDEVKGIFDFSKNGPLSTTGSKVTMSFALGIIGKLFKWDLQMVIAIRNLFSHSLDYVDFSDPDLIAATEQLYFPKYGHIVVSPKDVTGIDLPITMDTPQLKFKETCKWLCGELTVSNSPGPIAITDEFLYPGYTDQSSDGE